MWNKCISCNATWSDGQFTPGCQECGGYALSRPCPICSGRCQAVWNRDTYMSNKMKSPFWNGDCRLPEPEKQTYLVRTFVENTEDALVDAMNDLCGS
ncbi:protein pinocchio-like [Patiria miniata]|uniref:Uncharacterized protein n=1 Tax=Patiria miniata TaxID=46514 RepID=A0A913ZK34_PATMI|nr:protein pinocchio-like [Patiria miniata]